MANNKTKTTIASAIIAGAVATGATINVNIEYNEGGHTRTLPLDDGFHCQDKAKELSGKMKNKNLTPQEASQLRSINKQGCGIGFTAIDDEDKNAINSIITDGKNVIYYSIDELYDSHK